ncbi:5,10-methylenetetrahydrofolate reductase [Komagataeibacter oboediens DSM 11826]|uniref:Methylenetetrahydrofolate reductase n=1 Tax=Komagataeibacter oboediens TaxID=65958 RepID=A0A318QTX4_9PROT|nr:methylenetetrahydrofolate reductase [Komagataeibacter oboediens]PYD82515.1 methylenetetrahydrofolate reductase [Komagataeibacter oboediens]GBQ07811.1 5,10-methylenetetrahydrofolate reductase [Komagataeibacter oboediens DSM 11826]
MSDPKFRAAVDRTTRRLVHESSIEMTPAYVSTTRRRPDALPPGTTVFITWLTGMPFGPTLAACHTIRQWGCVPVPHLPVRAITDLPMLQMIAQAVTQELQTDRVLLIAGGGATPAGCFADTVAVLRTRVLQDSGIRRIYVAGHPEGSPVMTPEEALSFLRMKQDIGQKDGLDIRIVSQLCFDPGPLLQWERGLRDNGITLPVHVGLPGLISPRMLVRYGLKCGVGQSLQFLKGQRHRLHRWFWPGAPEQVIQPVARAVAGDGNSLFQGFHFFPFGAVARTLGWREASGRP